MKKIIAIIVSAIAMTGCFDPKAVKTSTENAKELVDSFVYVRAKNGLCFAVSTTSRVDTGGGTSFTNQVVNVPCATAGL